MSSVYIMDTESRTTKLERVHCHNEDRELQRLLEKNLDLLLGEQINPEAPCRWLLVKREMPVIDRSTGNPRWAIDFFLVDQNGIPTLVECKRCEDTRARREIVAQMLEYAANGHHYWDAEQMIGHAQFAAGGSEKLAALVADLRPESEDTVQKYFEQVQSNLKIGKMRLIFFLEESSQELRSVVEFLSKQLQETEVFLVEARQYSRGQDRVVVPWLFGFTEEVRVAKRKQASDAAKGLRPEQGEDAFWQAVTTSLSIEQAQSLRNFLHDSEAVPGCKLVWFVSCVFLFPKIQPRRRGLFGIRRSGELELYFGYWNEHKMPDVTPHQTEIRTEFAQKIGSILGRSFDAKEQANYPRFPISQWLP